MKPSPKKAMCRNLRRRLESKGPSTLLIHPKGGNYALSGVEGCRVVVKGEGSIPEIDLSILITRLSITDCVCNIQSNCFHSSFRAFENSLRSNFSHQHPLLGLICEKYKLLR